MHHSLNQTELPFIIVCETKHIKINHGRNNIHYLGNCTLYPLYSIRITNKFLLSTKGNIKILHTFPIILEKTHLFLLHFCHFCCLLLLSFFSPSFLFFTPLPFIETLAVGGGEEEAGTQTSIYTRQRRKVSTVSLIVSTVLRKKPVRCFIRSK